MTKTELLEIVKNRENSGIEFKLDSVRPEQLAKEVVAMANLEGGRIVLGVDDKGDIVGIQRENLEEWVMDTVFGRYIHPMILPFYEEVDLGDNLRIAVISFPQGLSKPYVLRLNDREEVYIRVGSTSRLATREQQARLYSLGGLLHTELMPVPGTMLASLDRARLENYLRDIIQDPQIPASDSQWQARLHGLGFMTESGHGDMLCTLAGLILFGIRPRTYLKQCGLRIMAFPHLDKEYRALLDEVLDGPLVGRWAVDPSGNKKLIDAGLIETFSLILSPFISRESDTIDKNMRREKEWFYPWQAIREIVINALVHRDWTRFVDIEVCSYADRLEIISPGALPNSMTVEKMKAGQRSPRNPHLVEVLRDYEYVDARGMGIRTKVIPTMKSHGAGEPVFDVTDDYLKTVLYRKKTSSNNEHQSE